jgi:hypothetical protein
VGHRLSNATPFDVLRSLVWLCCIVWVLYWFIPTSAENVVAQMYNMRAAEGTIATAALRLCHTVAAFVVAYSLDTILRSLEGRDTK